MDILLPVRAIEGFCRQRANCLRVQTVGIDAYAVWVRTRNIKGLDAAMAAKKMPCNARIKRIGRNRVLTAKQLEFVFADDQVQVATHAANTAIASRCRYLSRCFDLKSNFATVAAPLMCRHCAAFSFFCQIAI